MADKQALHLVESIMRECWQVHPNSEKFEHAVAVAQKRILDWEDENNPKMTMFPAKTCFFAPDGINQVTIQFPDQDSAIIFFEWCRQLTHVAEV